MRNRIAATLATVLFLVLAGTGVGHALWSSTASSTATVAAGSIGMTQTGFDDLEFAYTHSAQTVTAPVTVTNTGSISAPYTLAFGTKSAEGLAKVVQVRTWPVASNAACTTDPVPATAKPTSWKTLPAVAGTLAPGASAIHCVQSTLGDGKIKKHNTLTVTLELTSAVGSWTSGETAAVTQSVSHSAPPSELEGWYSIRDSAGTQCIDGSGMAAGAPLTVESCSGIPAQQWKFVASSDGYVATVPRGAASESPLAWEIDDSSHNTWAAARLGAYAGTANQQWMIDALDDATVQFVNRASDKCLAVPKKGTQLEQGPCKGQRDDTFELVRVN